MHTLQKELKYPSRISRELDYLKEIRSSLGDVMNGKRIALGVTGSVSCYRALDLARMLMRYGADVIPILSDDARRLVSPDLFMWATGNEPVTELTGRIEHVQLGSKRASGADLVLVAPCTASTLGKIAAGIADTPVTAVVSVALGAGTPVVVAPAMHEPMYDNPVISENITRLKAAGVHFVEPRVEEGKAKLASPEDVVLKVSSLAGRGTLSGASILVTAGPTREHIDPIRVVSNSSSGKMGYSFARMSKMLGAKVSLVSGPTDISPPRVDQFVRVETTGELLRSVSEMLKQEKYSLVVLAGAPSDYAPHRVSRRKLKTSERPEIMLKLIATPKIISVVKTLSPSSFVLGFKAEYGLPQDDLIREARALIDAGKADSVVANDASIPGAAFGSESNTGFLIGPGTNMKQIPMMPKLKFAQFVLEELAPYIK